LGYAPGELVSMCFPHLSDLTVVREETKAMMIRGRLRVLREHKKLSQSDIEKRTGVLRCYISRVEGAKFYS